MESSQWGASVRPFGRDISTFRLEGVPWGDANRTSIHTRQEGEEGGSIPQQRFSWKLRILGKGNLSGKTLLYFLADRKWRSAPEGHSLSEESGGARNLGHSQGGPGSDYKMPKFVSVDLVIGLDSIREAQLSYGTIFEFREVVLERVPVPVVDLCDGESTEGPVAQEAEFEIEIEEDPSEPETDLGRIAEPEGDAPIELGGTDTYIASLPSSLAQLKTLLIGLVQSWRLGRDVLVVSTTRQKSTLDGLPGCLYILVVRIVMFDVLTSAWGEFYGEVEQKIKVELFLEQLNDIYDTLKYGDSIRVMLAAFRLRGVAKDWWLRTFEARALKDQPWTRNNYTAKFNRLAKHCLRLIDTEENKTRQFINGLKVELQLSLALLRLMGFMAMVEAAIRIEMADQTVVQRKMATGLVAPSYKCPGQGPWKLGYSKRPQCELRTGNRNRQNPTPGGVHV
ncbi:hypothetical protein M9H77_30317 [Catharanthus roseus]|uniref:Uncharacterized protein n=1 Tax=Catharanthus roseus TaxID=4058 RepID=A0ACB9ZXY4_CATRO|nr:hypothetical protein M9H77_30317 [Catharanthus roseus]